MTIIHYHNKPIDMAGSLCGVSWSIMRSRGNKCLAVVNAEEAKDTIYFLNREKVFISGMGDELCNTCYILALINA